MQADNATSPATFAAMAGHETPKSVCHTAVCRTSDRVAMSITATPTCGYGKIRSPPSLYRRAPGHATQSRFRVSAALHLFQSIFEVLPSHVAPDGSGVAKSLAGIVALSWISNESRPPSISDHSQTRIDVCEVR